MGIPSLHDATGAVTDLAANIHPNHGLSINLFQQTVSARIPINWHRLARVRLSLECLRFRSGGF